MITYLHSESRVRVDIWQTEEVCRPDKEVTMESVEAHATSATYPHDRLESNFSCQISKIVFCYNLCQLQFVVLSF